MATRRLFGLFVGVDEYAAPNVPDLGGCVNDAERMRNYIETHYQNDFELHIKTLYNTTATRDAILQHFHDHFMQATAEDLVFFFYAGHGSTEKAHAFFNETSGRLQTLVCHDSRTVKNGQKVRDIVDKEMRFLIHRIWSQTQAEIIYCQDSCHSGGATRSTEQGEAVARLTDSDPELKNQSRAPEEFLAAIGESIQAFEAESPSARSTTEQKNKMHFAEKYPQGAHLHLAACSGSQSAYEVMQADTAQKGGVFTHNLVTLLERSQGDISYQSLFERARLAIAGVFQQTPQIYVHGPDQALRYQRFLGAKAASSARKVPVLYRSIKDVQGTARDEWIVGLGAVHGIWVLPKGKTLPITVVEQHTGTRYEAEIFYVLAEKSLLRFLAATPPKDALLQAELGRHCFRKIKVGLYVSPMLDFEVNPFLDILHALGRPSGSESQRIRFTEEATASIDFEVRVARAKYEVYKSDQKIFEAEGLGAKAALQVLNRLLAQADTQTCTVLVQPEILDRHNPFLDILTQPEMDYYTQHAVKIITDLNDETAQKYARAGLLYCLKAIDAEVELSPGNYDIRPQYILTRKDSEAPCFKQTDDLSKASMLEVLAQLEKASHAATVTRLVNPISLFKKNKTTGEDAFPFEVQIQSDQLVKPYQQGDTRAQFRYQALDIGRGEQEHQVQLRVTLKNTHHEALYLSVLHINSTLGIQSLIVGGGEEVQPHQSAQLKVGERVGLVLTLPPYMAAFELEKLEEQLQIIFSYNDFDSSILLQESIAPPQVARRFGRNYQDLLTDGTRRGLRRVPLGERASDWGSRVLTLEFLPPITPEASEENSDFEGYDDF